MWGTRPCAVPLESVDKLRLPNQHCQCNSLQLHIYIYIYLYISIYIYIKQ